MRFLRGASGASCVAPRVVGEIVRPRRLSGVVVRPLNIVTGALFGLVGIAHLLRLFVEDHALADPWFLGGNMALFVIGGGLAVWAMRLFMRLREPSA